MGGSPPVESYSYSETYAHDVIELGASFGASNLLLPYHFLNPKLETAK